jgi:hypothetical protein
VSACLAVALVLDGALWWHLDALGPEHYPRLAAPLEAFPAELPEAAGDGDTRLVWVGLDLPGLDDLRARLPFRPDGLVWRRYRHRMGGPEADLYMVHSRTAADRKHHPEICMREANGAEEDRAARAVVYLDGERQRPVQRFRFRTGPVRVTTIYYWHCTIGRAGGDSPGPLQALHERFARPAPSLTVQAAFGGVPGQEEAERLFLVAVDDALRRGWLPDTARIGCDRLPVVLVGR